MNAVVVLAALLFAQVPALVPSAQNGAVVGLLKTQSGAPATGVRVAAMAVPDPTAPPGGGALVSLTQTDNSGKFRLENVPPGRYYIQAGLIDFPSYYPGVSSTAGATSVQVTAGSEVAGIDFAMTRPPGIRISGRIPLGITPRPTTVRIIGGTTPSASNTAQINADGSFEFLRVTPGSYTVSALPNNALPNISLVVNDKDIDLGLPAGPGVKVSGTVGLGSKSPKTANQKVFLTGTSAWAQAEAAVDPTGAFVVPVVPPGTYTVRMIPGSATALTTIVVANQDISGIVLPAFLELSGRVVSSILPSSTVALMIEARRSNGSAVATAIRQDGTFRLPIHEGEYRIGLGRLPAGVSVGSLVYGAVDLLKDPLKLDGSSEPTEIRLSLEKN